MSTKRKRGRRGGQQHRRRPPQLRCGVCHGIVLDIERDGVVVGEEGGGILDFVHRGPCLLHMRSMLEAHGYGDPVERFLASMEGNLEKWRDGIGYDLEAIAAASDKEKEQIQSFRKQRSFLQEKINGRALNNGLRQMFPTSPFIFNQTGFYRGINRLTKKV